MELCRNLSTTLNRETVRQKKKRSQREKELTNLSTTLSRETVRQEKRKTKKEPRERENRAIFQPAQSARVRQRQKTVVIGESSDHFGERVWFS